MYFVISDIHGSITYLEKSIEKFNQSKCEYLLVLGDLLNHGPRNPMIEKYNPKACIELLNQYKDKIIAVRGNCDSEVDQMVFNFPMMASNAMVHYDDKRVFVSHGHLYDKNGDIPFLTEDDIYLFGHSHIPEARKVNGKYILNPGSITYPKGGFKNSYGILSSESFRVLDFDDNIIIEIDFESKN